jgi:hypothetical protein
MSLPSIIKIPDREIIKNRDIRNITGLKKRGATYLSQRIRKAFNKPQGAYITKEEFCSYTGISEERVNKFLKL